MTTAIDTCVLMDIVQGSRPHSLPSAEAVARAGRQGQLVIVEVVYAELASFMRQRRLLDAMLDQMGIDVTALGRDTAYDAGRFFAAYRRSGGARSRILADFLIAAHALTHADRLLTRDRGFYREYFAELPIMDAAAEPEP